MSNAVDTPKLVAPEKALEATRSFIQLARQRLGRASAVLHGVSSVCSVSLSHENRDLTNDEAISVSCLTNIAIEALDEADRFIDTTLAALEVVPAVKPMAGKAPKTSKAVRK